MRPRGTPGPKRPTQQASVFRYTVPQPADLVAILRALLTGGLTREAVAQWAREYVAPDEAGSYPAVSQVLVRSALEVLATCDARSRAGQYLEADGRLEGFMARLVANAPAQPAPPLPPPLQDEVVPPVLALPQQGYRLSRIAPRGRTRYKHQLCGSDIIRGATCPNCRKPLQLHLSLDTRDPRLELSGLGEGILPLLYCWTCPIASSGLRYRVTGHGAAIELLWTAKGKPWPAPYPGYRRHFPAAAVELTPLPEDIAEAQRALNAHTDTDGVWARFPELRVPGHQVGGEPLLLQRQQQDCSTCGSPMPLIAVLGNETTGRRGFTETEFIQVVFTLCRTCREIGGSTLID